MKLKYYLRGLGIGVLVSAFIMGAAINGEAMTDEEIKARAAELGMTEQRAVVLSDLIRDKNEGSANANDGNTTEPSDEEGTQASDGTGEAGGENGEAGESSEGSEETEDESEEQTGKSTDESEEPTENSEELAEGSEENGGEVITIVIERGDSSLSVSRRLAEAGLVADAGEYDRYLCNNGYSKRIRMGTYKITMGSSEEEIAEIIMGK